MSPASRYPPPWRDHSGGARSLLGTRGHQGRAHLLSQGLLALLELLLLIGVELAASRLALRPHLLAQLLGLGEELIGLRLGEAAVLDGAVEAALQALLLALVLSPPPLPPHL